MAPKQQMRVDREARAIPPFGGGVLWSMAGAMNRRLEGGKSAGGPTTSASNHGVVEMRRCALFLHRGAAQMYSVSAQK